MPPEERPIPDPALARRPAHRRVYTDEEAQEILTRAMSLSEQGVSRESLLHMADDLGISPEELERAEVDWEEERHEAADRTLFQAERHHRLRKRALRIALHSLRLFLFFGFLAFVTSTMWLLVPAILSTLGSTFRLVSELSDARASRTGPGYERAFERWRSERQQRLAPPPSPRLPADPPSANPEEG